MTQETSVSYVWEQNPDPVLFPSTTAAWFTVANTGFPLLLGTSEELESTGSHTDRDGNTHTVRPSTTGEQKSLPQFTPTPNPTA